MIEFLLYVIDLLNNLNEGLIDENVIDWEFIPDANRYFFAIYYFYG